MRVYGLKSCDTCRKALREIEAAGMSAEFIDIRSMDDLAARLPGWLDAVGADALINRRSTTWRGLDEAERARAEADPAAVLANHPSLVKRPVAESAAGVTAGWTAAAKAVHGMA